MLCSDGDDCKVRDKKVEQRMVQTDVHSHAAYPLERSPFVVPLVAHTDTENRRYRACKNRYTERAAILVLLTSGNMRKLASTYRKER